MESHTERSASSGTGGEPKTKTENQTTDEKTLSVNDNIDETVKNVSKQSLLLKFIVKLFLERKEEFTDMSPCNHRNDIKITILQL